MHHWYVVQTKPKKENQAIENLERQGYTAYCPKMAQAKRRRQRWQKIIEPLFPRYLFVQLAMGIDDFGPIRSTLGVLNMVRFGNQPATIPQQVIDTIHRQEQVLLGEPGDQPTWQPGDKVQVVEGAFAGLNGIFEKTCGTERVIVLLDMLGRQNRVTVETHDVVPVI
ncbi:transcription/translation regulatory transformer protein RfaH [Thiohalophilus sp.]|uniref:transcription/translation regulatory transformer protein RfaH n=1 Tax=Thiohalophilus sp. TaxID=3028392 RepID=UPI002ACE4053|nr:transcription/translation regulatory transformer protein RfaH [Thiohalophilus sp.]MDZ7804360.1 transcription/translation regulatory transformer protein RfaH [Thiohalophilus sp.]